MKGRGECKKKTKLKTSNKFYTNANKAEPSDSVFFFFVVTSVECRGVKFSHLPIFFIATHTRDATRNYRKGNIGGCCVLTEQGCPVRLLYGSSKVYFTISCSPLEYGFLSVNRRHD